MANEHAFGIGGASSFGAAHHQSASAGCGVGTITINAAAATTTAGDEAFRATFGGCSRTTPFIHHQQQHHVQHHHQHQVKQEICISTESSIGRSVVQPSSFVNVKIEPKSPSSFTSNNGHHTTVWDEPCHLQAPADKSTIRTQLAIMDPSNGSGGE